MRIIISPAKQMRVDTDSFACSSLPVFMEKTEILMQWIRSLSYEAQKKLWACNDKIARQNAERFAHMDLRKNLTPALLAYDGIQYTYMSPAVFEDGQYDSARYYLEIVFEKSEDTISKIRAAEFLRTIYDRSGQKEKTDTCVQFLANHKKSDAENKAFVSELNKLFQNYLDKKKEIQVEKERKSSVLKVVKILVPLAVLFALLIIVIAKLRRGRLLKKQQTEADRLLEEKEIQHEKEMRQQQENAEKALEDKEKQKALLEKKDEVLAMSI